MEIPTYATFVISLTTKVDLATQTFIATGFNALVAYLERPVALACTLFIALTGYGILHGFIEMSTKTFSKLALTIGGVYLIGFSWAHFSETFIALFLEVANELAGVMVHGKLFQFPFLPGTGTGLNAALQTVLIEAVKVGGWVMAKGGFTDWIPYFIGLAFMLGGTLVVALAAVEVIVVKLYLAMLLAVAPFFLACLLFPQSKGQFDGWLAQLKGFSIALMLLGVAVGLCMYLMHWVVGGFFLQQAVNVKIYSVVPLVISCVLCLILMVGIIPIAKQIGGSHGGSGMSAVGGVVGGMAGGLLSASTKGLRGTQSLARSAGKLSQSGQSIAQMGMKGSQSAARLFSHIRNHSQQGR